MAQAGVRSLAGPDATIRARTVRGLAVRTVLRLVQSRGGIFGLSVLLGLGVVAIAAPLLAPHDPYEIGAGDQFESPSSTHPFGTDELGRDVFSRILFGARISLAVALASAWGAFLLALPLGLLAGYVGGVLDIAISRLFDTIFAFPSILLGIALVAIRGASLENIVLAVAVIYVPMLGRLTRISVMIQLGQEYVEAARAAGASGTWIVTRHILPNVLPPLLVQMTLVMADAVLLEAAFSFLGLGIRPPEPSWGVMLDTGRNYLAVAPWLGLFAGLAVTVMILALNALGDALRVALDPRRYAGTGGGATGGRHG
ncbi:MAG: peptide/nickel transport system permease protein [Thermomicrobiales bacterium]|nr:peptide/nickel transport system permease protein [Thermomicrobiales bacterium]